MIANYLPLSKYRTTPDLRNKLYEQVYVMYNYVTWFKVWDIYMFVAIPEIGMGKS